MPKFFLTIRDERKGNIETIEFSTFEAARDVKQAFRIQKPEFELVIGSSNSKEEFLTCFSEYRKSNE